MIDFLEQINPFYKGLGIMLSAIILSFSNSVVLNILVFLICLSALLLLSTCRKDKLFKTLLPLSFLAVGLFLTGFFFSNTQAPVNYEVAIIGIDSIYGGLQLATRIFAFAGLGLLFSLTTYPQSFINSLQHQAKLSPKFAYGILAAFHLMPNLKQEYANAQLALRARGMKIHPFSYKPIFNMFVNVIRWSESLAMAMESKGFDEDAERTYYEVTFVTLKDYLFCISICGLVLVGVILF